MTTEQPSEPPPEAESPYVAAPEEDLPPVPDDTDDTRGRHLRELIGHPLTVGIAIVLGAIALIAVGTQVNIAAGAGAAAAGRGWTRAAMAAGEGIVGRGVGWSSDTVRPSSR